MINWLKTLFAGATATSAAPARPTQPVPLAQSELAKRFTLLCEAYVGHPTSFEDLRHWRQMVANRHPNQQILCSLDNLGQAQYTSFHAVDTFALDDTAGHDLSHMGPERFEDGEFTGNLCGPEDFPIRLANFRNGVSDELPTLNWTDSNTGLSIAAVNADPDTVVGDPALFQVVPVTQAAEMVAAFPNGYFSDDLNPFQLCVLAAELEGIGYQLMAIGASYVAFWADHLPNDMTTAKRSAIVSELYDQPDIDALNAGLGQSRHLILRFTQ